MWPWTRYPYTNFQELNLDYILNAIRKLTVKVQSVTSSSAVNPVYPTLKDLLDDHDIVTGSFASTVTYHAGVNGGGATYEIVETAPATYYEYMDDGRYAKLVFADEVNVKQFGAYGDNIHDDRAAFQNAINSGATVLVPLDQNELYLIDGVLNITSGNTDCIRGNCFSLFGRIHFSSGYFNVSRYAMRFENLFIEGASDGSRSAKLFNFDTGTYDVDAAVVNCTLRYAVNAVVQEGRGLTFEGNVIANCDHAIDFTYNGSGSDYSLNSDELGGRGFIIRENKFHSLADDCIILHGTLCNIQIINNYVENCPTLINSEAKIYSGKISNNSIALFNSAVIILSDDTENLIISDNNMNSYRKYEGLGLPSSIIRVSDGNHTQLAIANNLFQGCSGYAINMSGASTTYQDIIISTNVFNEVGMSDTGGAAIAIRQIVHMTCCNNIVNAGSGIRLVWFLTETGSSDITLVGNIVRASYLASTLTIDRTVDTGNIDSTTT